MIPGGGAWQMVAFSVQEGKPDEWRAGSGMDERTFVVYRLGMGSVEALLADLKETPARWVVVRRLSDTGVRSEKELLSFLKELENRGIGFKSLDPDERAIDTGHEGLSLRGALEVASLVRKAAAEATARVSHHSGDRKERWDRQLTACALCNHKVRPDRGANTKPGHVRTKGGKPGPCTDCGSCLTYVPRSTDPTKRKG